MRRTRKWAYVAQEARRLADLGLVPSVIAKRLEVNQSTVCRWMATGQLKDTRRTKSDPVRVDGPSGGHHADEWATAVRRAYALDATDEQLVELATSALTLARDPLEPASVRLAAAGRFQALVKQLALVARTVADEPVAPPPDPPAPRTPRADPRGHLMTTLQ